MDRLLIHAFNIHQGGGAVLLINLLQKIPDNLTVIAFIDSRMEIPEDLSEHVNFEFVKPNFLGRLSAEFKLSRIANEGDVVLCFGNLPPLFKNVGRISVFIQNRFLVDRVFYLLRLQPKLALRLLAERIWLGIFKKRVDRFFVQTKTMQKLVSEKLRVHATLAPFAPTAINLDALILKVKNLRFDFIYVASAEAHKNHKVLVSAWALLAAERLYPTLALTLRTDDASTLIEHIEHESKLHGLKIQNLGHMEHHRLIELYQKCGALIYVSDFESFGLPLIEAKILGLDALAPELDYVRDIINPKETFDPSSAMSIARAIKRYMKVDASPLETITPGDFLSRIMESKMS